MASQALIDEVVLQAQIACGNGFESKQMRRMNDEEVNISARAAQLGVEWVTTQPVSNFVTRDQKETRRKYKSALRNCRTYIEENWESSPDVEGVGFLLFSLISAVIWHLMVTLIVRWIVQHMIDNPEVAVGLCQPS